MSAFNTVVMPHQEVCARCGSPVRRRVQFKYGDTRQHEYTIGESLKWGGNDIGAPATLVRVLGYLEECPVCGYDDERIVEVVVRDNRLCDIVPGDTREYVERAHTTFIVIEP